MQERTIQKGSDLFIVDNSDQDWKVRNYLHEWADLAHKFDIATGYFEIGALLALDGQWQKLEKIRILMGDEVSKRTKKALLAGIETARQILDDSIEREKEKNDFLTGVPAIVDAIRKGQIECRIYTKEKFHAKAYITHAKHAVIGATALVGSSNFTYPGMTDNVELNIQIRREVDLLQEWYERHWEEAQPISEDILKVIERHTHEYSPFEVYAKALQEYFRSYEMTPTEWEQTESKMYPILDQYQKEGYQALVKIARQYGGAFICDGVGLGKTFVGLMLIERLVMHDRKRVALFVPKATRADVWERDLKRYLSHIGGIRGGDFSNLVIFNHTDLGREGDYPYRFDRIKDLADVIIIDEAHHFRNPGIKGTGERRPSRYRLLFDIIDGLKGSKEIYMMTATPINNRLDDFRHVVELFTRQRDDYFKSTLGIHSLRGHFIRMENELKKTIEPGDQLLLDLNMAEAEKMLTTDILFRHLVVQRSRAYAKQSQIQQKGSAAIFPIREAPKLVDYSVRKTYGRLLEKVEKAFAKEKPLFVLGIYYPLAYYKGVDSKIDPFTENRQEQVVGLIRIQFLKRFESSVYAFELSCERLLLKLLAWVMRHSETDHEKKRLELWKLQHEELIGYVHERQQELFEEEPEDADEDIITEEMLEEIEYLNRDEYKVDEILADTFLDLNEICDFLEELRKFKPQNDDKLKALIKLLKTDSVLKKEKVLIFSEFAETARYLSRQLKEAGISGVEQIDSGTKRNRSDIIQRFSPYYNGFSSPEIIAEGKEEIRVLISTDVLSEGLNLQDAARLINYDLHWNPVRLMQRIGRVDRRMNPETEQKLLNDHPDQESLRGKVIYWNFLPPDEIDTLLGLYNRVSHKTLRISKAFGIEGKKLLHPEDDYDALKEFNHTYEGTTTPVEEMHLEYQQLLKDFPDLPKRLSMLPGKVFSGKQHPRAGTKGVFLCYSLPGPEAVKEEDKPESEQWSEDAGFTRWYLYDIDREAIIEEPTEIIQLIRSKPDTPRHRTLQEKDLSEIRTNIEKHIKNSYFKKVQAPVGVKATLKAWMELS